MKKPDELAVLMAAARRYLEDRISMGETSVVLGPGMAARGRQGEAPAGRAHSESQRRSQDQSRRDYEVRASHLTSGERQWNGTPGEPSRRPPQESPQRSGAARYADAVRPDAAAAGSEGDSERLYRVDVDRHALEELEKKVKKCANCSLHNTRSHVVFGGGSGRTGLVFVGEAPGRDEDLQGIPFVGRAGQLLTRIIEAIKFTREDVYITNVIKCRPEGNRDPLPEEVRQCSPYLAAQLEILKPKVICALGRFAAEALSGVKMSMAEYRRAELSYNGIRVIATYHPAACLRNPDLKKLVWEDVQKLRDVWRDAG